MNEESPLEAVENTGNLPEFSVSELSAALKRTVEETFPYVRVRGEVSRVNRHSSGHCYFDLKDERASLSAVVWRGSYARLAVKPEQGLEVVCTGKLTTFPGQSRYQIMIEQMELAGLGALMAMLEARKKKLEAEGLFATERKKPLPYLPRVIGVVTSPTGAVIRDIMHRLSERCPRPVLLWPVSVQGERAPAEIVAAIKGFNALPEDGPIPRPDVLIVGRGGGSFEDLLAFSDETVVRAAAASKIPLISAVGHETDTTLIDYASDRRAPTPTAAAEFAVPVLRELAETTSGLQQRLLRAVSSELEQRRKMVSALARALPRSDMLFALPRQRFDACADRLRSALHQNLHRHEARLQRVSVLVRPHAVAAEIARGREASDKLALRVEAAYRRRLRDAARALESQARILESVSYRGILERGFALVRGANGKLHRRAVSLAMGERVTLSFADGGAEATISKKDGASSQAKPVKPKEIAKRKQGDFF